MKKPLILLCLFMSLCLRFAVAADAVGDVAWENDLGKATEISRQRQQLILVDFYAEWCGPCKQMEKTTFNDPRVIQELKKYVPLKIDIEKDQATARKYGGNAARYRGNGIPATMLMDGNGTVLAKVHGYLSAGKLLDWLENAQPKPGS